MLSAGDPATGLFTTAAIVLLAAIVAALARGQSTVPPLLAFAPAGISSLLATLGGLLALGSDRILTAALPGTLGPALTLRLDRLGDLFLVLAGVFGIALCLCGAGRALGRPPTGTSTAALHLALLALLGVFAAGDVFSFILSWGLAGVGFAALAAASPNGRVAALRLLIQHSLAGLCLALAFFLLAGPGGELGFETLAGSGELLTPGARTAAGALFLAGFGIAAGMAPFHRRFEDAVADLPPAGAALATALLPAASIYGLVRAGLVWVPGTSAGPATLLLFGAATVLAGSFRAIVARDLQRLVIRSTTAGLGSLLVGLGVALALAARGDDGPAAYALTAALYGTIALVTGGGLLALATSALAAAAGSLAIDRLGGLFRRAPRAALAFLAAAAATAALPPFHGFAARWMSIHALLVAQDRAAATPLVAFALVLATAALALGLSLGLAAMIQAAGMTLLARPRSSGAKQASDAPFLASTGLLLLAFLGLALGLFAGRFVPEVGRVSDSFSDGGPTRLGQVGGTGLRPSTTLSMPAMTAALLVAGIAPLAILLARRRRRRDDRAWTGGARSEATATSTSILIQPLTSIHRPLFGAHEEAELHEGSSASFPRRIGFAVRFDPSWRAPIARASELVPSLLARLRRLPLAPPGLPLLAMAGFLVLLLIVVTP